MTYYSFWQPSHSSELYHYGVIGMKWGVHKTYSTKRKAERYMWKNIDSRGNPKYSKDDPRYKANDQKYTELYPKIGERAAQVASKSKAHLEKINAKYMKAQAKADAKFHRAEQKANSLFATKRSADKAFRKAAKAQYKANRIAYKGKRFYEEFTKATGLSRSNRKNKHEKRSIFYSQVDKETRKLGEDFIKRVEMQSKAMYANSYR